MSDDDQPRDALAELTAVKALLSAILSGIGTRDRALLRDIIDACPTHSPAATDISPSLKATKITLDQVLDPFRHELSQGR